MNLNLPFNLSYTVSHGAAQAALLIAITLLAAMIADLLLKSFIKVPKHFDNRRTRSYVAFFRNTITIVVYAIAIYTIFTLLKIDLTPLLASAAVIGVVISISSRSIIEDVLSGLFLLGLDSIAIGDYVKIDDDPKDMFIVEGVVEKIGIRTTSVRSYLDGALYVIPNGKIKKFVNLSRPKSSIQIDLVVKADQKIDDVLKIANDSLRLLEEDEELGRYLLPDSKINGIESFQTFGHIGIRVSIFTYPSRRLEIARKYRYIVKKGFEKHKIKIG